MVSRAVAVASLASWLSLMVVHGEPHPNAVDCAFRKLAVKVAARNLNGDSAKLAIVATGLNVSSCPGGLGWASEYETTATPPHPAKKKAEESKAVQHLYVSPTHGDDNNVGDDEGAPMQSLAAAQARVRKILAEQQQQHHQSHPITINLMEGIFYESVVLGPEDSGCQQQQQQQEQSASSSSSSSSSALPPPYSTESCKVTWQNYPGDRPVVSGGVPINCTWLKTVVNGNVTAYSCKLAAAEHSGANFTFTSLFIQGARLQRARYPNGDPSIPCNGPATCAAAGYTAAVPCGESTCKPDAVKLAGAPINVYNGETLITSGIVPGDPTNQVRNVSVSDSPFQHDAGAFFSYSAYTGGGVACYNSSLNAPFWNAGTCNCKYFGAGAAMAARASRWTTPSTGVVRMFHSAGWGGWAFDVDDFSPNGLPPPPPPPPPPPGWGPLVHCTSCLPHDNPIRQLPEGGTLEACQDACIANSNCTAINFAVDTNQACYLFAACSKPWNDPAECKSDFNDWWTTQLYTRPPGGATDGKTAREFTAVEQQQQQQQEQERNPHQQRQGVRSSKVPTFTVTGGQQTGQQGPVGIFNNNYYVENIFQELDVPGEWYFNASTGVLYVVPTADTVAAFDSNTVVAIAAVRPRVIQVRGSSPTTFAHDINIKGVTVMHSAPTFMADYEMPSGGDWAIHRGGAIFLDGTEDVSISEVHVDHAGGNGIFLSQHAWRTNITNNVVNHAGDSAILVVGSTELMNGTRNTYPAHTNISNNLCYEMGFYGKQTAAYFKAITYRTSVTNNVFFNSPRSLVNYNDAFRGGDYLADNVMWGAVKETQDHASFNSWDRQSYFWQADDGAAHVEPEILEIQRNLILNKDYQYGSENSDWSIDHDDASSFFEDSNNVMVYGSHKWRDGVHKWYFDNLYVTPEDAGSNAEWGIGWYCENTNSSKFYNNTFVSWTGTGKFHYVWSTPFPSSDFDVRDNTYYTPGSPSLPFKVAGGGGMNPPGSPKPNGKASAIKTLADWQSFTGGNDRGSTVSADFDLARTMAMAEAFLLL